jgi:polysaccharide biosynthesis/export protein
VARPGRFPWQKGMRIHDLIPTRDTLITRDYWVQQNSAASNKNISGLPEVNWVYALISRMGPSDLSNQLIPFNLGNAVGDANSSDNLELQAGDVITIFSQADVRVPERQQSKYVYLEGEVTTAGVYRVALGETLRELVTRVGGLTPQAYLFGSEFTRESTRVEQQARVEEFTEQLQREAQHNAGLLAVKSADNSSLAAKLQMQQSMLDAVKQLKANGRIVLGIRPSDNTVDAVPGLVLENGDRFYIPSRSESITVMGEVVTPSTLIYDPQKRIREYLRKSGGATRFADQARIFVLRADGSTLSKHSPSDMGNVSFDNVKLMPGDAIVVPQKLPKIGIKDDLKDWGQIMSQFGLGVAAINLLK